jgi:hypothetical protein
MKAPINWKVSMVFVIGTWVEMHKGLFKGVGQVLGYMA